MAPPVSNSITPYHSSSTSPTSMLVGQTSGENPPVERSCFQTCSKHPSLGLTSSILSEVSPAFVLSPGKKNKESQLKPVCEVLCSVID